MPSRITPHFEIREKLGEGGMGVVYSALDQRLNRIVALKFLPPRLAEVQDNLEQLLQEARATSALNHNHIATIYGVEEEGEDLFLVLEYLPGGTLKTKLQEAATLGRWLPIGEVLRYAIGAAEGLAYAHRRGIVHLDVKTSNLMLTEESTVKITDFGLAKLIRPRGPTRPGLLMGTAAYMAPEQVQNGEVDARSDVFSFGVTLFELATGRLPFEATDAKAVLSQIISQPAPRLREFRPDAPPALEAVVGRALEKRLENRYQSMDELVADLHTLREALAREEHNPTIEIERIPPQEKQVRRRWLLAVGLAGVLAAALSIVSPPVRRVIPDRFRSPPGPTEKLVAVLPHRNVGRPEDEPLCVGLVEILTNKLTQLEQFQGAMRVVAASDVLTQPVSSSREARSAFGAALALTVGVRRDKERLTIMVGLVDTKSQVQLAAHTVEHREDDLPFLEDLLLQSVAEMLTVELKPEARQTLARGMTAVPGAYSYYVAGRGYLRRHDRMDHLDNAIAMFQLAVREDPNYALAYAGMAEAFWREYQIKKDSALLERARTHGVHAIHLNDQLAPVQVTMGLIRTSAGQYEDAVRSFRNALQHEPLDVDAHRGLARAYEASGRTEEAEAIYQQAIRLRPNSWASHKDLGVFYFYKDRYRQAEASFRRVIELTPDNYQAYTNLGAANLKLGRNQEAAALFERSLAIRPEAFAYSGLGSVYYFQGRYAEAAVQFEKAKELAPKDPVRWGSLADAYRWAPALSDRAPEAFRKAIELAEGVLATNPKDARLRSNLAIYRSSSGDRAGSLQEIEASLRLAPEDLYVLFRAALVYEQAGMRERALIALEACLKAGYSIEEIRTAPSLAGLRKEERYRRLEEARSEGYSISPGKRD